MLAGHGFSARNNGPSSSEIHFFVAYRMMIFIRSFFVVVLPRLTGLGSGTGNPSLEWPSFF